MKNNKTELVRKHLVKKGKITTWEAITKYRATRLSDIIYRLRNDGWSIMSEMHKDKDGMRYAIYHLRE